MSVLPSRIAAAMVAAASLVAHTQVIDVRADLSTPTVSVFNDRIGNSRFFAGPNSDRVRVSAFVIPSPDSDVYIVTNAAGQQLRSLNGGLTAVSVSHPVMGTLTNPRPLTFVGLTSLRGGGRNEYTTTFDRANAVVDALLDAWVTTPFTVTATNPDTFSGIGSVTAVAPPFDKNALPAFVTDLKVTTGLTPTLSWQVPAGATPDAASLQIRLVQGESDDGSRITAATLVHAVSLPVSVTSYTIGSLNNAALLGLPPGLQLGRKYEISVQLDAVGGGVLKGRSRTFFEYTPLSSTGSSNVAVYLPSVGTNGAFKFNVAVSAGTTIDIDPATAIGYVYETGLGDPAFRVVSLPNVGDGVYTIDVFDPGLGQYRPGFAARAGASHDFTALGWPQGVAKFRVKGIEASAQLDSTNTTAFVTTVGFTGAGRFTGTMTPITGYALSGFGSPVNLPPTPTTTRAGATLPLKWTLSDKQGYAVTDLTAVSSVVFKPTSCASFTTDNAGASPAVGAGGSALRYDRSAGQYVFNWKTPATAGCYSLFVTLDTAQSMQANVMLTQ